MLLVRARFAEIVKVGETIEDGLKIGKIARVAAWPGSSGLLKKKREDVSSISYEGKKTPKKSSSYQGRSRLSQSLYLACYAQKVVPNVKSNPLPNHGGVTINMIETDADWCVTKAIVLIAPDELEKAVASLSIREKKEFVILTPEKLVNVIGDDLAPQPHMPSVYKMIATIMLWIGFEPSFGMEKHFQGIVEPIQIPAKRAKFGLRYVPTDDEAEMKNKCVDQALARPIPHLYQSFPVREYVNDDGLGEGIWGLFEKIDAVIEEEARTTGIRDAEPEEQLQN
uniref:Uncharacterized protein n=1 Tax=Solanum tuberosum TaxID=4113 RepID=M1BHJ0_SOLTU